MKNKIEEINQILAAWNPIGVPENIALHEYKEYIPIILNAIQNNENLIKILEDILINKMGLEYDSDNLTHLNNLSEVHKNILLCVK